MGSNRAGMAYLSKGIDLHKLKERRAAKAEHQEKKQARRDSFRNKKAPLK